MEQSCVTQRSPDGPSFRERGTFGKKKREPKLHLKITIGDNFTHDPVPALWGAHQEMEVIGKGGRRDS